MFFFHSTHVCFANNTAVKGLNVRREVPYRSAYWEGWWCITRKWPLALVSNTIQNNMALWEEWHRLMVFISSFSVRSKTIVNSIMPVLYSRCVHVCGYYWFLWFWQEIWIKDKASVQCKLLYRCSSCTDVRKSLVLKRTPQFCLVRVREMLIGSSVCWRAMQTR